MKILKTLLFCLLLIITITFSIRNSENVRIRYFDLIGHFEIPLFLLVLLLVALGVFAGTMMDLVKRQRLKKAIRKQQKILDELQEEFKSLRNPTPTSSKDQRGTEG